MWGFPGRALGRAARLAVLSATLVAVAMPTAATQAQGGAGVVVETVDEGSAGQRAGLRPGDVLSVWERPPTPPATGTVSGGTVASPFELTELEIEEAPRGPVTLSGSRQGQPLAVTLPPGRWQTTVRPQLPPDVAAAYASGQAQVTAGHVADGVATWRAAAVAAPDRIRAWLLLRAALTLRDPAQLAEAHALLAQGLAAAQQAGDLAATAGMLDAQGQLHQQHRQFVEADRAYRGAMAVRQGGGGPNLGTAKGLVDLAYLANAQQQADATTARIREALELLQRLAPGSFAVARAQFSAAFFAHTRGEYDTAAPLYRTSLESFERMAPDSRDFSVALNNYGSLLQRRGELASAATHVARALAINERLDPTGVDVGRNLGTLGLLAADRGRFDDAERYQRRALAIYRQRVPGSREEAAALNNLATVLSDRGDLATAEVHHLQALAIRERIAPDTQDVAASLHNLGALANTRGDPTRALDYYTRSLAIAERVAPESLGVAQTLNNLGEQAQERGDLDAAEAHHRRALAIKKRHASSGTSVAATLANLGHLAEAKGDLSAAQEHFEAARMILESAAAEGLMLATVLGALADVAQARHDDAAADRLLARAVAITERLAPASTDHAVALRRIGRHASRRGDIAAASEAFARAIDALESQTTRVGGSAEARTAFAGKSHEFYVDAIAALMTRGRSVEAFAVLERSRARGLLMLLAERDLVLDTELPPALRETRRALNEDDDQVQAALARLDPTTDAPEIDRLQRRLRDLREQRARLMEAVRAASPRLAALQAPQPLDVAGVHRSLDPGTVLLSYHTGPDESRLFVVHRTGTAAPPSLAVHTIALSAGDLQALVTTMRRQIERQSLPGEELGAPFLDVARRLYDALIAPAEKAIAGAERVLIVPDGPLHSLPFAALVRGTQGPPARPWQYLVEWKPLHTALSATVYAELRKTPIARTPEAATLIAFGDPVYSAMSAEAAGTHERGGQRRAQALEPLPASRAEVDAIRRIVGARATIYLGAEATEARAKSVRATRYLHFATHGLLDAHSPLDSALALMTPPTPAEGLENGLLQAWEIFEQVRLDADLVTLSACETALGAELAGEGLIGLTRAFHYAGARTVLASLWRVADDSTATLMADVYRHLRDGARKDEALRRAQLAALARPATATPFHWAAFTLSGDWR